MAKKGSPDRFLIRNKKAGFRFEFLEKLECGLELKGSEVKSLRAGQAALAEAFAIIVDSEMWLIGCHINAYDPAHARNHDPTRKRRLLAHRREILKWEPKVKMEGLTLVPLDIHFNDRGYIKVTVALAKGKTVGDKRRTLKKRDAQREIDRAMRR